MDKQIPNTRVSALMIVNNERTRQDIKWGTQNHEPAVWTVILGEEFGEFCEAVNETIFCYGDNAKPEKGGYENMIEELTHVAAVAVGAIECLMRNKEGK